jgi:NAD(P)-dependent dehydrogenase (short-subunit alcohol dehydrogenase family)
MTDVSNQRVGFVGLGDQGGPMALAIVEAGFLLHAWARRPQSYGRAIRCRGGVRIHHWEAREELDAAVTKIGKNIAAVQGDVSNLEDLDRLYAKIAEDKGRVDVVFANAGTGNQRAPLGSITEEQIDRTFNVNVRGLIVHVAVNIWSAARLQGDS